MCKISQNAHKGPNFQFVKLIWKKRKGVIGCKIGVKMVVYWQALDIHQQMGVPPPGKFSDEMGTFLVGLIEQGIPFCVPFHQQFWSLNSFYVWLYCHMHDFFSNNSFE